MASKNANGKSYGSGRTRNFATVIYPESAVENWKSILEEVCVPIFISPIHDQDLNPDGEKKKSHYHILIAFDTVKTIDQAKVIVDSIGGVGCEQVNSLRGYARYLCHLDNPDKYQYSVEDVVCLGGADYLSTIGLPTDKYKILGEMQDFCEQYNVFSFYLLAKYARANKFDWYRILCDSGAVYMREYLKSKSWSKETSNNNIFDQETGEVII